MFKLQTNMTLETTGIIITNTVRVAFAELQCKQDALDTEKSLST